MASSNPTRRPASRRQAGLPVHRYLTDFDSARSAHVVTETLVIGSGVAGCRAALEASHAGSVILATKRDFEDSCTTLAQGGIAVSLTPEDSPERHMEDTLRVGCGLCNPSAVRILTTEGPDCVRELLSWGIDLDRTNGKAGVPAGKTGLPGADLQATREGGHSVRRIVHAHGDQTGRELMNTLHRRVMETPKIRTFESCFLIDLITMDGVCHGAVTFHEQHGHQLIWAQQTILATGGCGQLWRETTNPSVATGDGIAAAYRAGADLHDMEMIQFHPTTLYVAGSGRALISEAVRGEGGLLVDRDGHRFMTDHHPDAELAPRDIVSRAIHIHLKQTRANCVYLDVRHIQGFADRFPHITKLCADFEVDVSREPIPVRPSAHYMIGGVATDSDAATSVPGLLCCGELASTGVHGANRLASNSLLEGLVFGRRAGRSAANRIVAGKTGKACLQADSLVRPLVNRTNRSDRTALDLADIRNSLRSLMWRNVGIVRNGERLRETCEILDFWAHYTLDKTFDTTMGWEIQNALTVAKIVATAALERTKSIGVHFRDDTPADPDA